MLRWEGDTVSRSLGVLTPLAVGDRSVVIAALDALGPAFDVGRLPYTLRILLEMFSGVMRSGSGVSTRCWPDKPDGLPGAAWARPLRCRSRRGRSHAD